MCLEPARCGPGSRRCSSYAQQHLISTVLVTIISLIFIVHCLGNPCDLNNGGCSELCHPFPDGSGVVCSCFNSTIRKIGNGGGMCVPITNNCTAEEFVCGSGKCLLASLVCDLDDDCEDGSDEDVRLCANHTCPPGMFKCRNGRCIANKWLCDHDNDCRDNSDELNCSFPLCGAGQFTCANYRCIDVRDVCNGRDNCRDGNFSDEAACPPSTCPPTQIKCGASNICIQRRWLCDGDDDCGDGSDEIAMFCQNVTCERDDFRCPLTHRCIASHWRCDGEADCSDGADEAGCDSVAVPCPGTQFSCNNSRCVSLNLVCNGEDDCGDESDEGSDSLNCSASICPVDMFRCASNALIGHYPCIPQYFLCNGVPDCLLGEDETGPCATGTLPQCSTEHQFTCRNGRCVLNEFLCDGDDDCGDLSDEPENCTHNTCSPSEFRCTQGSCINAQLVCNGFHDCRDHSDENEQLCEGRTVTIPPCRHPQMFLCDNGECIESSKVCNKLPDCSDGSDEPPHCFVNECLNTTMNHCAHRCVDTNSSFYCECDPGFELMSNKRTCADIDECSIGGEEIRIRVVQPQTIKPCSQLCVNTYGSYVCKCVEGYVKGHDSTSCKKTDDINEYLLFTNRYYLRKYDLRTQDYTLLSHGYRFAVALDYDSVEQRLYVSDVQGHKVLRSFMNGTGSETLVWHSLPSVEGLAVDWIGRKLYLGDNVRNRIVVSELNGTSQKTLVEENLSYPRALAVHPYRGYLFWSDWGHSSYIGRVGTDGHNKSTIISTGLGWPNALTVDLVGDRIWWGDAHLQYIGYSNLDGSNRHTLLEGQVPHPFSITLFEDWMYWTDWNHKSVERANRFTGANRSVLVNLTHHRPMDVHVIHPLVQRPASNPCGTNNGGCSHLCLIAYGGESYTCTCPDFFFLSPDRKTCEANCSASQFRCGSADDRCIPLLWKCDGERDCMDGSDEPADCAVRHCPPGQFQCSDLNCTLPFLVCDGTEDCSDGSDEHNCDQKLCQSWQFRCASGRCIASAWSCDGENDCGDNSDEAPLNTLCVEHTCRPGEFTCDNGRCVPRSWLCDSDDDCGDMSDERQQCSEQPCPADWMRCRTNYRCVPKWELCDGVNNCRDNSDEDPAVCPLCHPTGDFQCSNKRCVPMRWRCDFDNNCGDGSDELNCEDQYRQCSESEFRCDNHKCIAGRWRCDHDDDCSDGSDERNCEYRDCVQGQFRCSSNLCIDASFVCDGDLDCQDASDELNCSTTFPDGRYCPLNKFSCNNRVCIPKMWVCDGDNDCGDSSDETEEVCSKSTCESDRGFRCGDGKCLPLWRLCDTVLDCSDGSDENNSTLCGALHTHTCRPLDQFKCANKACINSSRVCDNVDDCGDLSDELGCHQGTKGCSHNNGGCAQGCRNLTDLSSHDANSTNHRGADYVCYCNEGFRVAEDNRKSCQDIDECAQWSTNLCPQECVNLKGSYKCRCVEGFMDDNRGRGTSCRAQDEQWMLLIAVRYEIRRYIPDAKDFDYSAVITAGKRIQSMAVDIPRSLVYWSDSSLNAIYRAVMPANTKLSAEPQPLNIQGVQSPTAIAFDWVARVLYWTDSSHGSLNAASEDGRYTVTLVRDKLLNPSSIAVNPSLGLLYWSDVNVERGPRIEVSWMTGAQRRIVVDKRLNHPVGLTIDYSMGHRVFWCDTKENTIESMKPDGSDRVTVIRSSGLNHPVGLDVFENWLFIVSEDKGAVSVRDKFGQDSNRTLQAGLTRPHALLLYHPLRYNLTVKNRCAELGCWPLCLLTPSGGQCVCPNYSTFLPNSNTTCDASAEAGKALPKKCLCYNSGVCVRRAVLSDQSIRNNEEFVCHCVNGYKGELCEIHPSESDSKAAWVAVIILALLLIIAVIAIGCWLQRSRRGKSLCVGVGLNKSLLPYRWWRSGDNEEPTVSFRTLHNDTSAHGADFVNTSDATELSTDYNNGTAGGLAPRDVTNPMYADFNSSYTSFAHPALTTEQVENANHADGKPKSKLSKTKLLSRVPGGGADPSPGAAGGGFKPVETDTGRDTQQLIESDNE